MGSEKLMEAGRRLCEELQMHWGAACDADPVPDGFIERMEQAGFVYWREVTDEDLEQAFADEVGICKGGTVWDLTDLGRAALSPPGQGGRDE